MYMYRSMYFEYKIESLLTTVALYVGDIFYYVRDTF